MTRPEQITQEFLTELDKHLDDIVSNKTDIMFDVRDFAKILNIHPVHLSNTIKQTTGKAPCDFCEAKILEISKQLLRDTDLTISSIAIQLTYDPSNFTKFFKKYSGQTPSEYRNSYFQEHSETITIKAVETKYTFA
jgi:AraC family transcriptional regulator of adaptative response / methylphosphotriester-DNA alkyltransferase methyltransferase